jgi:hypothetical protein
MKLNRALIVMAVFGVPRLAYAETWMVQTSTLGCGDREVLTELQSKDAGAQLTSPRDGCVVLHAGERLLDLPGMAVGFDDYLKLERHDGSVVFVPSSAVVSDPGIGSASEDR